MRAVDSRVTAAALLDELRWMVRLRWAAAFMLLAGAMTVGLLAGNSQMATRLAIVAAAVLACNVVFWIVQKSPRTDGPAASLTPMIGLQILIDLVALALIVAWSGGVESPLMAFFFLYVVASSVLISSQMAYIVVAGAVVITAIALRGVGQWPATPAAIAIAIAWPLLLVMTVFLVSHITSDLRRHRTSLRHESERYRAILETAADAIITIDASGIIQTINPACERMFGYSQPELIGRNISMLMPQPMQAEHDSYLGNYLRTGHARIIGIGREVEGLRKDGTVFPVELAVSEIQLGDERLFTGVLRDITARHESQAEVSRLYEELKFQQDAMIQQEKMAAIGQMAAGVAHEISNPLASMDSLIQLITRKPERLNDKVVGQFREQVHRISHIVRQLTEFAHPLELGWATVPVNDLVTDALELLRFDHRLRRIQVDLDLAPEHVEIHVVPQAIQQVLVNLLGNAIDALEQTADPRIDIEVREGPDWRSIRVGDNGQGIPERNLNRIFDPFFTTKPVGRGTGLGLSISYNLIKSHGGEITVESRVGQGTAFTIRLPASCKREEGESAILDSENHGR